MEITRKPELVFGLVGPIGCDIATIERSIERALKKVDYAPHIVSVSSTIGSLLELKKGEQPELLTLRQKIDAGNEVRRAYDSNGVLAAEAIRQIREVRSRVNQTRGIKSSEVGDLESFPADAVAYIIRQLKRPEEIELLSKTYGKQFIQVSVTQSRAARFQNLVDRLRRENHGWTKKQCEDEARELIEIDENEDDARPIPSEVIAADEDRSTASSEASGQSNLSFGQKLTEIFHLADAFISADDEATAEKMTSRFIDALFGKNNIAPTKDEFGSYMAKAASLRSVDLSRQVGAALLTPEGDIVSIGCNEVPKAGGGNFWDEDINKSRDIDKRGEANKEETNRIVFDFLRVLDERNLLKEGSGPAKILDHPAHKKRIMDSLIGGITEYGRMVHAEMNAISDAARLGRSVLGTTLYVTTFPCHNCAKHIIASGVTRVVFIEPYPKSKAEPLYVDAISTEKEDGGDKVLFSHFEGISPRRFRDIFEKGKRRQKDGTVDEWYKGSCTPRIGSVEVAYWDSEVYAISENLGAPED